MPDLTPAALAAANCRGVKVGGNREVVISSGAKGQGKGPPRQLWRDPAPPTWPLPSKNCANQASLRCEASPRRSDSAISKPHGET
jgi:hypothetical protein